MNALHKRLNLVQKDAVDRAIDLLDENGKCLIVMTTGTGKTIVGAKIIQRHHDKKILWLTQTDELITQTRLDLQGIFGENAVGLFKGKERSLEEKIIVASLQTITKEEWLKAINRKLFDLLIVDEAHHSQAITWRAVIDHFQCNKLGLTATPFRNDGRGIDEIFGETAFILGYEEAKEMGLIASEVYRVILTNSQVEGIITKNGEYAPKALDRLVTSQNRNQIILDSYVKYARPFMKKMGIKPKAICFCISVAHANRMNNLFNEFGIKSEVLTGRLGGYGTSEKRRLSTLRSRRKEIYNDFLNGTGAEILCTVNVLNEGKNIPDVGCVLMVRPTRSRTIFKQQLGRGCRRIEGVKEKFMVLDYVDMMNQKYPPMTLSRITGERYILENIIPDYYKGKDPIVIDDVIHYLSPSLNFYRGDKWNRDTVANRLLDFYQKHGKINLIDLSPATTGLPGRQTIKRFWTNERECFKELNIPWRGVVKLSKSECEKALKEFYEKNGKMTILDLGRKNHLPSQKLIYTYWGAWNKCAVALGFKQIKEPKPKGTPGVTKRAGNPYRGVWKHHKIPGFYRSELYHKGKRINVGYFESAEEARDAYIAMAKKLGKKIS